MRREFWPRRIASSCRWTQSRLYAFLDGELDPAARDRMLAHTQSCPACSEELAACSQAESALRRASVSAPEAGDLLAGFHLKLNAQAAPQRSRWPAAGALAIAAACAMIAVLWPRGPQEAAPLSAADQNVSTTARASGPRRELALLPSENAYRSATFAGAVTPPPSHLKGSPTRVRAAYSHTDSAPHQSSLRTARAPRPEARQLAARRPAPSIVTVARAGHVLRQRRDPVRRPLPGRIVVALVTPGEPYDAMRLKRDVARSRSADAAETAGAKAASGQLSAPGVRLLNSSEVPHRSAQADAAPREKPASAAILAIRGSFSKAAATPYRYEVARNATYSGQERFSIDVRDDIRGFEASSTVSAATEPGDGGPVIAIEAD